MTYLPLKAGDIRQAGDEFCHKGGKYCNKELPIYPFSFDWFPVSLLKHEILPIDLHVTSFRRPLP